MKALGPFVWLALIGVTCTFGQVIDVNDKEGFKKEVSSSKSLVFVEFFAPWCGHCKKLGPEWASAAKKLEGAVKFVAVDCTVAQDVCQKYGVQGYPTIKIFGNNKNSPTDYQSARESDAIVATALGEMQKFLKDKSKKPKNGKNSEKKGKKDDDEGPKDPFSRIAGTRIIDLNAGNFAQYTDMGSNAMWLIGTYKSEERCADCKAFLSELKHAAKELEGDVFVGAMELENTANNDFMAEKIKSSIPGIIDGDGKISVPSMVQYQPGNNVAFVEYTGPRTGDVIVEYAKKESLRLINVPQLISEDVVKNNCDGKTICVLIVLPDISESGKKGREEYIDKYKSIAKKVKSKRLAYLWSEGGSQLQMETAFGVSFGYPALLAFNVDKGALAVHVGSYDFKAMETFIHGLVDGTTRLRKMGNFPNIATVAEWDGGEAPVYEEEFDLAELMGDEL